MADMGVMEIASLAATGVGAVSSMAGAQQSAAAQSQMYQYQAAVAQNNQTIANSNAQLALEQGQQQEAAKREQTAQTEGRITAAMGAAGVDPTFGTAVRLQSDTAKLGETDALTIRNNAANAATGYRNQGLAFGAQAGMDQASSENALTAGNLNAFSSFASGIGSVASKWYQYGGTKATSSSMDAYMNGNMT